MTIAIAVDTGGTFTDLVAFDTDRQAYVCRKHLTTYDDFVRGIAACLGKAGLEAGQADSFRAGTTLVINTLLQRTGARTALVTTRGFADVLEMGRGNRTRPYDLRYRRHAPLVPRDRVFEVAERVTADGEVLTPLDEAELDALAGRLRAPALGIEAVAVSFLNSYRNASNERAAMAGLAARLPGVYVTAGMEVTGEWHEYERSSTAAANAYVGPRLAAYVGRIHAWLSAAGYRRPIFMMGSHGGAYSVERARREPIMLVESGPVGGCVAAAAYAEALALPRVVAFDMGGTTAKCCVVQDGRFEVQSPYYVGGTDYGFPVRGSVLDIVEVGAGGGSIAAVDAHGRLSVGPASAGSEPGPACYGRGGLQPTISDANLVLGRIAPALVGGEMVLDSAAAAAAIESRVARPLGVTGTDAVARAAQGVLDIGVLTMADAIRQVTIQKGLDPREFVLVAYGGGGPLHAADLARDLAIPAVVIPCDPGVFSAFGMLMADGRLDEQVTFLQPLADDTLAPMQAAFRAMEDRLARSITAEIGSGRLVLERYADLRYRGQGHAMRTRIGAAATVAEIRRAFDAAYRQRYGHANEANPLQFVQLAVSVALVADKPRISPWQAAEESRPPGRRAVYFGRHGWLQADVHQRAALAVGCTLLGPAVVEEYGSSTLLSPGDRLEVGRYGELRIDIAGAGRMS